MSKETKKKDTDLVEENSQLTVYSQLEVANSCLGKRPVGPSGDFKNINIESLIRTIRGQKVMVDFGLAMKDEWNTLRSQFATTKDLSKIRTLPYAFTRNGIGMLSSVLGSDTAVAMNIRIMRAFTTGQQIMESNAILFKRVFHLEQHQQETDEKISILMAKMDDISPKLLPEQVFATGCVWDAWTYVSDLVRSAKQRIVLIDNFVDDCVLSILDKRADHVEATIHSRYYESFQTDLKKHNEQYREIKFVQLPHRNHDRFLIIDDDVYLLGTSVKDMGVGMCAVTKMQISPETILRLLK